MVSSKHSSKVRSLGDSNNLNCNDPDGTGASVRSWRFIAAAEENELMDSTIVTQSERLERKNREVRVPLVTRNYVIAEATAAR
jgi:hypothetical protein